MRSQNALCWADPLHEEKLYTFNLNMSRKPTCSRFGGEGAYAPQSSYEAFK